MALSCELNDYVQSIMDNGKPIWVASLDDGRQVFQDDDRPGETEPSAWIRLGRYLDFAGRKIVRFRVKFHSNMIWLPHDRDGYFFAFGVSRVDGGPNIETMNVGCTSPDGDKLIVRKLHSPSLLELTRETRETKAFLHADSLIMNPS